MLTTWRTGPLQVIANKHPSKDELGMRNSYRMNQHPTRYPANAELYREPDTGTLLLVMARVFQPTAGVQFRTGLTSRRRGPFLQTKVSNLPVRIYRTSYIHILNGDGELTTNSDHHPPSEWYTLARTSKMGKCYLEANPFINGGQLFEE